MLYKSCRENDEEFPEIKKKIYCTRYCLRARPRVNCTAVAPKPENLPRSARERPFLSAYAPRSDSKLHFLTSFVILNPFSTSFQ